MNKILRYIIIGMVIGVLLVSVFSGGLAAGYLIKENVPADLLSLATAPTPMPETTEATPDELTTLFTPFWEAWQIVHDDYVDQPVDDLKLMQGAISGMLDSLGDEHTSYMDPHVYPRLPVVWKAPMMESAHGLIRQAIILPLSVQCPDLPLKRLG